MWVCLVIMHGLYTVISRYYELWYVEVLLILIFQSPAFNREDQFILAILILFCQSQCVVTKNIVCQYSGHIVDWYYNSAWIKYQCVQTIDISILKLDHLQSSGILILWCHCSKDIIVSQLLIVEDYVINTYLGIL